MKKKSYVIVVNYFNAAGKLYSTDCYEYKHRKGAVNKMFKLLKRFANLGYLNEECTIKATDLDFDQFLLKWSNGQEVSIELMELW